MNDIERFRAVMRYQSVDRIPFHMVSIWPQTLQRWHREGLPKGADPNEHLGIDRLRFVYAGPAAGPFPPFDERIISEDATFVYRTDRWGRVVRDFQDRMSMPEWEEFPVKTADDLRHILDERFDPDAIDQRWPGDWEQKLSEWRTPNRDYGLFLDGGCCYNALRNLSGVETASYLLHDAPMLCAELFERINFLSMEGLKRVLDEVEVDYLGFGEDIAFKTGPLMSPEMVREMICPHYRRGTEYARDHGLDITWYDSDGDLRLLLDDTFDAGISGYAPLEVAAGMNPLHLRQRFGKKIQLIGGIDKREVAKGPAAIRKVFREVVRPLLAEGGYLPAIDHSVSADISWDNYRLFVDELLAAADGRSR